MNLPALIQLPVQAPDPFGFHSPSHWLQDGFAHVLVPMSFVNKSDNAVGLFNEVFVDTAFGHRVWDLGDAFDV